MAEQPMPLTVLLGLNESWIFAAGEWRSISCNPGKGVFDSAASTRDGVFALVRPTMLDDGADRRIRLLRCDMAATLHWRLAASSTQPHTASKLTAFSDALFAHADLGGERMVRVAAESPVPPGALFPEHMRGRYHAGVSSTRQGICIAGGRRAGPSAYADMYAPEEDRWTQLPSMLVNRHGHALAATRDGTAVIAIGGNEHRCGNPAALAERHDLRESAWRTIAAPPRPIHDGVAHALDSDCILVAGAGSLQMHAYDARADTWTTPDAWERGIRGERAVGLLVI